MSIAILIISLFWTAASIAVLWACRTFVLGTTLMPSWWWSMAAAVSVLVAAIATCPVFAIAPGWQSAAAYFAATMLLTPLVANLGARRPGYLAWQWFVVLPMVLVLQWPAITQLVSSGGREAIELSGPSLCGFGLVVVMSAGTYAGSALRSAVIRLVLASVLLILTVTDWTSSANALVMCAAFCATGVPLGSFGLGIDRLQAITSAASAPARLDAVWLLFQDAWGFAWASRVRDRINQFAPREQWAVTLTREGFRRTDGQPVTEADVAQPSEAFRWVLSRFLDEKWLAEQCRVAMAVDETASGEHGPGDSLQGSAS